MELTIVDESDTGTDIGDIHARQYVDCLSPSHGIDGRYLCVSKTTDYLNPANNTITIGASGVRLTSASVRQEQRTYPLWRMNCLEPQGRSTEAFPLWQ